MRKARIMIDPFTALAAATTAFNTVKKFVQAGQEFENTVGQMGKWYSAVSDFRKGQTMQKKPPLFKKLFNAGSVEEEALQLLLHEKRILEQENELRTMLNLRFGYRTWDELTEMRRKIAKQRDRDIYKQAEMRQNFVEMVQIIIAVIVFLAITGGMVYWIASITGKI